MNGSFETQKIRKGRQVTKMRWNSEERDDLNRSFGKKRGKRYKLELRNSRRFKNKRGDY